MFVALVAHDKPDAREIRNGNRPAHLDYLNTSGHVAQAGPLLNGDGEMIGSPIILDVPDLETATGWAEGDPYAKAGLFADVTLTRSNPVIG